jgi:2-keto-4-pentenoate hydratase/2-oxohepta-3-ene-1,7-dioic acid hydratase in catechol pathway/NAD(P)-dependent dehydrogenase (short-subunit alcohol dehydrogenase family)
MVKLARILTTSSPTPILTAQISTSSAISYVDLSSIASNATQFLSLGPNAIERANSLIDTVISPNATAEQRMLIIPESCLKKILSPLDGRTEVNKFLCIGMNYVDHCTEQNVPVPTVPLVFSKFGSCIVGPDDGIPRYGPTEGGGASHAAASKDLDGSNTVTSKLDFEVELGIVIGSTVPRFTSATDAVKYIGGYTVIHDVSARDLQLEANGGQWLLGKAGDGYAPMGPVLVTMDEFEKDGFGGAGDLHIECRLTQKSGEVMVVQSSSTKQLVFSTPEIVSYISKFMTLHPGDVIATGTPPGVGCFRKPDPLWLEDGDVVECEIEKIGVIRNRVVESVDEMVCEGKVGEVKDNEEVEVVPSCTGPLSAVNNQQLQSQRLQNTVCIVTGAARGLGYGIALRLAQEGANMVALIDMNQSDLDEAKSQLQKESKEIDNAADTTFSAFACDVTNSVQVADTIKHIATISPTGRIDILVQSAGVVGQTNLKTHQVKPSNFDFVMSVNVKGIFNGCQAVLPYMLKQRYGRIINIASIAGKEGNAGMLAYSTSKAAVIGLTKTIGKEYALDGITCNAIAPAVVRTKMVADMPVEQVKYMTDKIPMKRCGKVEEIAALAAFIGSEDAAFTTGFCFDATGGRSVY